MEIDSCFKFHSRFFLISKPVILFCFFRPSHFLLNDPVKFLAQEGAIHVV